MSYPSDLIEVTPSGTVGKQVYASTRPVVVKSVILTAPTSAATAIIRDGNASGTVMMTIKTPVGDTNNIVLEGGKRFDKGLHAKVTGVGALCYLEIC